MYLRCSLNTLQCFLHIEFPIFNQIYCLVPLQSFILRTSYSYESKPSDLDHHQKYSIGTFFTSPMVQIYPASYVMFSLHDTSTDMKLFSVALFSMCSIYLTLKSISRLGVVSRWSDIPTIKSLISLTTAGPSWSKFSIMGNILFAGFCLVYARFWSIIMRVSVYSPSSVLSPSST